MPAYRIEATVERGGRILLEGVPFAEGETVEVVVLERTPRAHEEPAAYPAGEQACSRGSSGEPSAASGTTLGREEATMQAVRIETTVQAGGKVTLERLPFRKGDRVEVTVVVRPEPAAADDAHPYWGKPFRYDRPTDPVAEDDWEVLK